MPASRWHWVPTIASAALLAGLGASGLLHGQGRTAADVVWLAGDSEWTRLDEREATLHQRRQAEELLGAFTRAQLTRHYWGQFASSLIDLGLVADPSLKASVDSQSLQTRLWLTPRRGDEAYLSQVSVDGGKLRRLHCRGPIADVGTTSAAVTDSDQCPAGWTALPQ